MPCQGLRLMRRAQGARQAKAGLLQMLSRKSICALRPEGAWGGQALRPFG